MVVLQQPTEPFPALDLAGTLTNIILGFEQSIAESLMISLGVVIPRNTTPTLR